MKKMRDLFAKCSKHSRGQVKIQQMAFVLVAIMIFFAIVALFYITIRSGNLKEDAGLLREEEAKELVRKVSSWPEFKWEIEDCAACIDMDKVLVLKDNDAYKDFWDVPFLQIEKIYPPSKGECTKQNYPDCRTITLAEEDKFTAHSAFVALCRYDSVLKTDKCELGKIHLGFRSVG